MTAQGHSWRNACWALLIAAALLLRIAVPQGYMLDQSATGGIEISLCNSGETWVIPMKDGPRGDHDDQDDGQDEAGKACSFAGHSAPATEPDSNLDLPLPQLALAPYDGVRQQALSPATARSLPPARGPPTLV